MQLFMLIFAALEMFSKYYTHIYTGYIGSFRDDLVSWALLHYVTWISIQVDASCEIVGYPAEVSWIFQVGELCFRMTRCFLIFWLSDSVVQLWVSYSWFLIGHKILHHRGGREKNACKSWDVYHNINWSRWSIKGSQFIPLKQTDFNRKVANNCKFFSLPYNGGYERLMTERKPLVVTYTLI